ncbi:Neurofibromin 1, partial [Quaeritorhiza haematococci]
RDTTIIGQEELRLLLSGITGCLLDPSQLIREKAAETLLQLFDPEFVSSWDGSRPDWRATWNPHDVDPHASSGEQVPPNENSMRLYWRVSCQVLLSIARQVLLVRGELLEPGPVPGATSSNLAKAMLELIRELLRRRNEFLRLYRSEWASVGINSPDRFAASVALEVALLVFLCSADTEVSSCAVQCLGYMVEEAEITGEIKTAVTLSTGVAGADTTIADLGDLTMHSDDTGDGASSSAQGGVQTPGQQHQQLGSEGVQQQRGGQGGQGVPYSPRMNKEPHQGAGSSSSASGSNLNTVLVTIVENVNVYRDLRGLFSAQGARAVVTGQKAQQKRIRKILRYVQRPTPGNMGAWEEIYKRWHQLNALLTTRGLAATQLATQNYYNDDADDGMMMMGGAGMGMGMGMGGGMGTPTSSSGAKKKFAKLKGGAMSGSATNLAVPPIMNSPTAGGGGGGGSYGNMMSNNGPNNGNSNNNSGSPSAQGSGSGNNTNTYPIPSLGSSSSSGGVGMITSSAHDHHGMHHHHGLNGLHHHGLGGIEAAYVGQGVLANY